MSDRFRALVAGVKGSPGLAILAVAAAGLPLCRGIPFLSVAATAFVLIIPGTVGLAALLPRNSAASWEAIVVAVGVSLALVIGSGLVLNLTPVGLDPTLWMMVLAAITIGAASIAIIRRRPLAPSDPRGNGALQLGLPRRREFWQIAAAVTITSIAIISTTTMVESRPSLFTQLWMTPNSQPGMVDIGVRNAEGVATAYVLRMKSGDASIDDVEIRLDPGEVWSRTLALRGQLRRGLDAELYRLPDLTRPYRHVTFSPRPVP